MLLLLLGGTGWRYRSGASLGDPIGIILLVVVVVLLLGGIGPGLGWYRW